MPHGKYGMNSPTLSQFPFVRIAIPFAAGILLFESLPSPVMAWVIGALAVVGWAASLFLPRQKFYMGQPLLQNSSIFLAFVCLGWCASSACEPAKLSAKSLNVPIGFSFRIQDISHENTTTALIGESTVENENIRLLVTLNGNDYKLREGDVIYMRTELEALEQSGFPDDFDFARYMRHKGIRYRAYIPSSNYLKIGHHDNIDSYASQLRRQAIHLIQRLHINDGTSNFAIAILTGERSYITDRDREEFSRSGLAHILAVSGLHIGIVLSVILLILRPLSKICSRKVCTLIILLAIWSYVVFAGLSPSAVRAAIMASFLFVAKDVRRVHSSINALFAAAFAILLFSPRSLFDVGFQLSFLAVIGIMLFADFLTVKTNKRILRYLSTATAVTISAQLMTAVLVIHYFNSFPTGFLLANVLAVPLLPVFMLLLVAAVILSGFGMNWGFLNLLLDKLYWYVQTLPAFIHRLLPPVNDIWVDPVSTILITAAIASAGILLKFKQLRKFRILPAIMGLSAIGSLIVHRMAVPDSGVYFMDNYTSSNIVAYSGSNAYIINSRNDTAEINLFLNRHKLFFIKRNIGKIHKVRDSISGSAMYFSYPFVHVQGKRYMFIKGNYRKRHKPGNPIHVDYAIITNNYYNGLGGLPEYVMADTIIISKEIHKEKRDTMVSFVRTHGIPYIAN